MDNILKFKISELFCKHGIHFVLFDRGLTNSCVWCARMFNDERMNYIKMLRRKSVALLLLFVIIFKLCGLILISKILLIMSVAIGIFDIVKIVFFIRIVKGYF